MATYAAIFHSHLYFYTAGFELFGCGHGHLATLTQTLCVCGGEGRGTDYDELQRNMANSGFLRIKLLKTTWTF